MTIISPPTASTDPVASNPAPAPAPEAAPVKDTTAEPVSPTPQSWTAPTPMGTTIRIQELEMGLECGNVDTDGDRVADGDEITIYGTDPFTFDSDGDGVGDGEELYNTRTDPLVWDAPSSDGTTATDGGTEAATSPESTGEATTLSAEVGDSDGDRLSDGDEAAIGTDPGTRTVMAMATTTGMKPTSGFRSLRSASVPAS